MCTQRKGKVRKQRDGASLPAEERGLLEADQIMLAPWAQISNMQNCEKICFYCLFFLIYFY